MNIESKARAGFTSIMLRGGRMTKWKGQVASYAPHVGHLQNVSVAAMAAALAFGGSMALPSEALAQDVTVTVDTLPPPPAIGAPPVNETNNGNGAALIINATVPVAGEPGNAGITATNGANATDITINATNVSGTSGIVVNNGGSGATVINANVITGTTDDGVNVQTGGNGLDINASQIKGDDRAIFIDHKGSGNINIDVGSLTGNDVNIAQFNLGENAGDLNIVLDSAGGEKQGIVLDSISTGGSIDLTVAGNLVVKKGEAFSGTGIDAAINSTSSQGDISILTNNVSAIDGISAVNAGTGGINVQSTGLILGAGGGGIKATQLGNGQGVTIDAQDIIANDFGVNVVMSDGQGNIDISANDIKAINVGVEGVDPLLPIAAAANQVGVLVSAFSQNAGDILVNVPNITAGTGIEIVNSGDGAALVESFGQILALAGDGVKVTQNGLGANAGTSATAGVNDGITLNLASVGAAGNGVVATMSSGQGGIDISADGIYANGTGVSVSATSANAGNILVNVTDVQAGTGIEIVNSGEGYALVQSLGQILTTSGDAINITQNGNGVGITVEANNIITSDFGIRANLQSGTGDINVTAANIDAGATAIEARNLGVSDGTNGNIDIAVSGNLISETGDGVSAYNGADARALKVSVNNVTAFQNGIDAENRGTGDSDIVAVGTIVARNYGIRAYNADTAGNLKVTANIVTSGDALDPNNVNYAGNAIFAQNYGNGDTVVTLNGAVTAHGGDGIKASNGVNAGDITITTADVTARDNAVLAYAFGDGANISITTNGKIAAGARYGIRGVNAGNLGGDVTIIATDDVVGNLGAIAAVNGGVGDINIASRAKLESTGAGTFAVSAVNVDRAGDINLELNDVTGVRAAVAVFNFGDSVVLRSTGKLSGLGTGLGEGAGVGVLNAAGTESVTLDVTDVEATLDDAILVDNQGTGFTSVSASGTVTGGTAGDGINVTHTGVDQNLTISATKLAVADANGVVAATVFGGVNGIIAVNNGTNAATTVTALGKTVGGTAAGISVTNNTGATDLAITANEVEGATQGILAANNGTGNTSVTVTSRVTGSGSYGISAHNGEYAGNLIINAGNVTGGFGGIGAENLGTGVTTITISGTVVGENFNGITAYNDEYTGGTAALGATAGTGLTIVSTKVSDVIAGVLVPTISGSNNGLYVQNFGAGATTLDIAGKVEGVNRDGIFVENGVSTLGMSIAVAAVTGANDGISAFNNGSNDTVITASGPVSGASGYGIYAKNDLNASNLTVSAGFVTGGLDAIKTINNGDGATSITVTRVSGGGIGINATNGVDATDLNIVAGAFAGGVNPTIFAAQSGIVATNNGTGNTSITFDGNVSGLAGDAINVTNAASAANVTIEGVTAQASIVGETNGIVVINDGVDGSTAVNIAGNVTGRTNDGINVLNGQDTVDLTIRANFVSGAEDGIQAINNGVGATLVAATDVTATTGFGIEVVNAATASNLTVNAGKVTGGVGAGADGISVTNAGTGFTLVTAKGDVTGTDEGIFAVNGTTATDLTVDAVNVGGGEFGIFANNAGSGSTTVRSTGVVDGQTQAAISATNAATALNLTVEANEVTGATFGVIADNQGRGATNVSVANFVSGGSEDAIRVTNGALASDLNITANVVEGAKSGVIATNNGTGNTSVTLGGNVTSGAGFNAIEVANAASANDLTINATNAAATITGGNNGILAVNDSDNGGSTSITVAGKVVGTTRDGINATNAQGTYNLTVDAANVEGAEFGVLASNAGSGSTLVKSTGVVTGGTGAGVSVSNTADALNLAVDVTEVTGGTFGVVANNQGRGTTNVTVSKLAKGNSIDGIRVTNGTLASDLNITANDVEGARRGVYATNNGTGNTSMTLSGNVTGGAGFNAIEVTNATTAGNLTINSTEPSVADAAGLFPATISGDVNGIFAVNNSTKGGSTSITVAGKVVGTTADGINVTNEAGSGDLSVDADRVYGAVDGVNVTNNGTGSTSVTVRSGVSGGANGISADNAATAQNLTIDAGIVAGGEFGILARNDGNGTTTVTARGALDGQNQAGISVYNAASTAGLTVSATEATGGTFGVVTNHQGRGASNVSVANFVSGGSEDAIRVTNGVAASDLNITANDVQGAKRGVYATNNGTGNTTLTLNGNVTGGTGFNAVDVSNAASAKDLTINATNAAATITGGVSGILAINNSTNGGSTFIDVKGKVIGATGDGIRAENAAGSATANLTVLAHDVDGGEQGIIALNYGSGATTVTSTGTVTGLNEDGIFVYSGGAGDITVQAVNANGKDGIDVTNYGQGSSSKITVTGDVVGNEAFGFFASNGTYNGKSAYNLTAEVSNVTGQIDAIHLVNEGTGSIDLTLNGTVLSETENGIYARVDTSAKNLKVTGTNAAATITGNVNGIFAVNDSSNGGTTSIDVKGKIVGITEEGINVAIGEGAGNLSVTVHDVNGNTDGIYTYNEGTGSTVIVSTGLVEGLTGDGILAVVRGNAGDLSISANNVEAEEEGIDADNLGTGSTSIIATGLVKGAGVGIFAYNGAATDNLSISANNVEGGREGVGAKNYGSGNTTVTLNGNVTGGAGFNAVDVINAATAKDLTITGTNAAATITGGVNGILAVNNGVGGSTTVSDLGTVQGETASGIDATNEVDALNLTVAANNVKGATNGVTALNKGQGNTTVALAGNATGGTAGFGLLATNAASAKDLTITASGAAAKIVGGLDGIFAVNNGGGSTSIITKGDVVGTSRSGINARNAATTVDLKIDANNVSGTDFGVVAINEGKGSNSITVNGNAVGTTKSGVKAYNAASATTLTVSVKNVTGGIDGLDVVNEGSGASTVSISGKVVGGTGAGLASASKAGNLTTINLAATADVSATSGNAILNNGGNSVLNVANGAGLRGTVRLGDGSDTANFALASTEAFIGITALDGGDNLSAADGFVDTLNLNGVGNYDLVGARVTNWEAININAGTVGFSDAAIVTTDLTVNAGGTLNAANSLVATANVTVAANGTLQAGNAAGSSRTRIVGNLASAGLVNLSGPAGSAKAGDTLAVTGNFTGNGGQVRLDTVLGGDNSPTDLVSITGNAVGGSLLAINNAGGVGGLTTGDGIRVVQVGGTSDRDAFALLGDDVQAGGFRYDLFLGGIADPNDQDWYLRTVGASDIAATTLSFARLSDDIAMTFLGTLHERVGEQEHLAKRGYQSAGTGGLWGRFVGKGFRERLSSATLGDIKSTGSISGLQMGLDFGRSIKSDGSATFTGAYAGYADGSSNDQNIFRNVARRSGSSDSKGWLTGLYATHYGSTGWYANAVVQATWVDASASARNGITLETDGRTYLGSVEFGKSLKLGNRLAFETQAQLIYGETRFDDARDSAGIANKIRIEDSLTGRVGFRLKTTKDEKYNAAGGLFSGYLKANLWHNLLGSDVRLNTAGVDLGKFEPKKTWVDAGLGTTLTIAKNTELFFDADVEIGLDRKTAAGTGKAGLRINW